MVRGSGSRRQQSNSRDSSAASNNRSRRNTAAPEGGRRVAQSQERSHDNRNRRGGGGNSADAPRRNASMNSDVTSFRTNRRSGSRDNMQTRGSLPTATTRNQRSNHGSGTRISTTTTTRENVITRERQRANHGNGTRRDRNTTRRENTAREERQRVNHGSGSHRERGANFTRGYRSPPLQHDPYIDSNNHHESSRGIMCRICNCLFQFFRAILVGLYGIMLWVLCWFLCCKPCRNRTTNDTITTTTSNHNRGGGFFGDSPCRWLRHSGLIFTCLVFLVLIRNSMMENLVTIDSKNNILTLFAGQTQRIYIPLFTREIRVTVVNDPPASRGVRAAMFKFQKCPPLNGPRVELQHDSKLDLEASGFVYDYYNFNYGSSVDIWFDQLGGGTYFYLLKGAQALKDIQTGINTDPNYWERIAVKKSHLQAGTRTSLHYQTTRRDDNDNIYTLVYDNESTRSISSIDVQTDITFTTHDLSGYRPICDDMRQYDSCRASASRQDCIVMEAFSIDDQGEKSQPPLTNITASDVGTISLQIDTYRNWKKITLLSFIPLFVSLLIYSCIFVWKNLCHRNESDIDHERALTESLLPPAEDVEAEENNRDRPPPTAPPHAPEAVIPVASLPQPSAPVEDGVVIVPPESVEVVTK